MGYLLNPLHRMLKRNTAMAPKP